MWGSLHKYKYKFSGRQKKTCNVVNVTLCCNIWDTLWQVHQRHCHESLGPYRPLCQIFVWHLGFWQNCSSILEILTQNILTLENSEMLSKVDMTRGNVGNSDSQQCPYHQMNSMLFVPLGVFYWHVHYNLDVLPRTTGMIRQVTKVIAKVIITPDQVSTATFLDNPVYWPWPVKGHLTTTYIWPLT